jgi:hypothetical protein
MIPLRRAAQVLQRSAKLTKPLLEKTLADTMKLGAAMVKEYIGQEHPGYWRPLSDRRIAEKTKAGQVGRISDTDPLFATGDMRDSATFVVRGLVGSFGVTDPKGYIHEMGSGHVPPRPFIAPVSLEVSEILKVKLREAAKQLLTVTAGDVFDV